jgi:PERQ amino acid-rich with GYF domain-containing protein
LAIPRRQSLSSGQGPLPSPRDTALASPRTRIGFGPSFDGVLGGGDSWIARRKAAEGLSKSTSGSRGDPVSEGDSKATEIKEEEESSDIAITARSEEKPESDQQSAPQQSESSSTVNEISEERAFQTANMNISGIPSESDGQDIPDVSPGEAASALALDSTPSTPSQSDLANVEWSYLDPQGNVQGKNTRWFRDHFK